MTEVKNLRKIGSRTVNGIEFIEEIIKGFSNIKIIAVDFIINKINSKS